MSAPLDDLGAEALAALLPDRALRSYPALVSTEADAMAWARADGPEGAVVVADYQASARGRAGWPWTVRPGESLGFSIVLRPDLRADQEGCLWTVGVLALAENLGDDTRIHWPDEAYSDGTRGGAVNVSAELPPVGSRWAVVSMFVEPTRPPRGPLLARLVTSLERLIDAPRDDVLHSYRRRCGTLGRRVAARLLPLGPSGVVVAGTAEDVKEDGSLVIRTEEGRRVAVRPTHVGALDID